MHHQLVLNIGPALMPDFVTGAAFHSILAWSTVADVQRFDQTREELMAGVIRLTKAEDPQLARTVMDRWPQIDWRSIEARAQKPKPNLGYLDKRLKQRMAAARMGIGKMHFEIFNMPAELPPSITALSIDQLSALVRGDVSIDDPDNIEKLVWRKSLPIIHLAIATQLVLAGKFPDRTEIGCDLQDIDFYRECVWRAQLLEMVVHDHPDVAMTRDRMTLIRWFE